MKNVWKTYDTEIEDKHLLLSRLGVSRLWRPWSKDDNVAYHDDDDAMMNSMMTWQWITEMRKHLGWTDSCPCA